MFQKWGESLEELVERAKDSLNDFMQFEFGIWQRDQSSPLPSSKEKPLPNVGIRPLTLQYKFPSLIVLKDKTLDMHSGFPSPSLRYN